MTEVKLCYWCRDALPPLPEDASYVEEINHYIHDECRDERDDNNPAEPVLKPPSVCPFGLRPRRADGV
jgi:hypothetical protein